MVREDCVPKHNAAIFGAATGMLPRLPAQLQVDGATDAAVDVTPRVDPGVDHQAGAGLEMERLVGPEARVEIIEKRGGGDLGRGIAGA